MGRFLTNIRHDAILTILDAKTGDPLLKRHLFVFVGIALLKEARGAVLHWHQRDPERGQLRVRQNPVKGEPFLIISTMTE